MHVHLILNLKIMFASAKGLLVILQLIAAPYKNVAWSSLTEKHNRHLLVFIYGLTGKLPMYIRSLLVWSCGSNQTRCNGCLVLNFTSEFSCTVCLEVFTKHLKIKTLSYYCHSSVHKCSHWCDCFFFFLIFSILYIICMAVLLDLFFIFAQYDCEWGPALNDAWVMAIIINIKILAMQEIRTKNNYKINIAVNIWHCSCCSVLVTSSCFVCENRCFLHPFGDFNTSRESYPMISVVNNILNILF